MNYCLVDAGGVDAEWVEATVATECQPTVVFFLGCGYGMDSLERSRRSAGDLAVSTGARVLTVACSAPGEPLSRAAVEAGVAAYAWLIGEGCNLDLTAFTHDSSGAALVEAILLEAISDGLPVPAGGIWPDNPTFILPSRRRPLGRWLEPRSVSSSGD